MKKSVIVLLLISLTLLVGGCNNKTPDVTVIRDSSNSSINTDNAETDRNNTTSDNEDVTESKEPISTENPTSTESQVSNPDEVVTEEVKGELDPNADELDSAGTGDVQFITGDTPKFINNENFLGVVPLDVVKEFNSSVQDDILDEYPDLTFVSYDSSTGTIYAESERYYLKFTQSKNGFNTSADLKKYASWWTFD